MNSYLANVRGYFVVISAKNQASAEHAKRQFLKLPHAQLAELAAEDAERVSGELPIV